MKLMKSLLHNQPFDQQIAKLQDLAAHCDIEPDDRYLQVYFELLSSIQALLPLDRSKLVLVAHAVFGWMPTQLRVGTDRLDDALKILTPNSSGIISLTAEQIDVLAETFQTANGRSVVAASKILHFIAPDQYPIWDRFVANRWGLEPNGASAAKNYLGLVNACRRFAADTGGQAACDKLRQQLATKRYAYPMSQMRLLELMLFFPPRD